MRIIRTYEVTPERRPDGRDVYNLTNCYFGHNPTKLFRVTIPKGTLEKEHMHTNSIETFLFLKPGEVIIENTAYQLGALDILIIDKNERHKIIAKEDMDLLGIKEDINDKVITEK